MKKAIIQLDKSIGVHILRDLVSPMRALKFNGQSVQPELVLCTQSTYLLHKTLDHIGQYLRRRGRHDAIQSVTIV